MKRILIATAASVLLLASAAHAAFNVSVDVDSTSYGVGGLVTIDLTLTTVGDHTMETFAYIEYLAVWDPAVLEVANAPSGVSPNGHSTQTIFPELSGSPEPACGFYSDDSCVTLSQVNDFFASVNVNGVVTAQLVLEVLGGAGTLLSDHLTIGIETGLGGGTTAESITIGPNYQSATIVPEPTAAALIGLGLVGLAAAGRRR